MSEIENKNQEPNLSGECYDDEDDLWEMQSTATSNPKQIDFHQEETEKLLAEGGEDQKTKPIETEIDTHKNLTESDLVTTEQSSTEKKESSSLRENREAESEQAESMVQEITSWLDDQPEELKTVESIASEEKPVTITTAETAKFIKTKSNLQAEIKQLETAKNELIKQQEEITKNISLLVKEGLSELEQKKQKLETSIQKLQRRRERIEKEMKTNFAGVSQDLAIRVQGFKDYLVGSLQDLAAAAEQLELPSATLQTWETSPTPTATTTDNNLNPQFTEKGFKQETKQIRSLLDQYRSRPDYYGPPWQLRRTFEPIHAERVSQWFFALGGRGAIPSMGSRLQNILVASAIISVLFQLYGDRSCTLILADTPERLGEWRRGLQDCLGISRSDFGPNRGVTLFETPEALSQRAERLVEAGDLPLVIIDQTDDRVSLSLLQFPLWLAFASDKPAQSANYFY
jgi:chaperonin cofactor prefoldin